jgi:Rha family phage regulatory protein
MGKLKKTEMTSIEIFEKDEQIWTTSLDVAGKFGKQHKDVLKAIRNLECSEEFRRRNFAPSSYQNEQKKDQKSYLISCRGFQRLGMSFTGQKAAEWKEKYIDAFEEMKDKLIKDARQAARQNEKRVTLEYKQAREEGKIARRVTTDYIKAYEELAKSQGSTNPQNYSMMTNFIYDGTVPEGHTEVQRIKKELGLENGRDGLPTNILRNVEYGEGVIFPAIYKKVTEEGGDYKEIKKRVKSTFLQLRSLLMLPVLQNNMKTLTLTR